eukprot:CAMPEP_0202685938 /NCGR_PEP_ID=MMETSP1385-20130828/1743_1 /ASSEMBLY_ACC=CAM_ASM_000861 /TAXON_ID=933848 /ORGANISM="Elphidium margaritaceum" /LENGTH=108 /DNA_ID=CAMNT_0049340411 /DNA_START=1 /DNA_END=327 /DNA_ORIENTATION=+
MEHFLGNVGVSDEARPQPLPVSHYVPIVDNSTYLLSLQSPWVMTIAGLLMVILTCNVMFMCYMRCCDSRGRATVSFDGHSRSKRNYKAVKVNDSEVEDEVHAINVVSE